MNTERACNIPEMGPDAYAKWRASDIGAITERLESRLILDLAGDVSGRKVLDVGCGDGRLALELAKRGAVVTGIDGSTAMINTAIAGAEQHNANVGFQVAVADHLPFPAEQFDVVTAVTILCFVDDADPVFREIARVLKPGGRFVIGELGKWSTWAATRRVRSWLGSRLWRLGQFRTAGELRTLAERAGLRVRGVRGAIFYPRCRIAARLMAAADSSLGHTTIGAAFIALCAVKPDGDA